MQMTFAYKHVFEPRLRVSRAFKLVSRPSFFIYPIIESRNPGSNPRLMFIMTFKDFCSNHYVLQSSLTEKGLQERQKKKQKNV